MSDEPATATFLFTDIEGSARLWEREPGPMQRALARHDAISRAAVSAHRGRLVKTTGDGIHAAFDDPADALQAVLALQRALAGTEADGLALKVRCGLHRGPAERRDGDFYGPVLNRAARIMAAAHGGQVLLSQAVADGVAGRLPAGAALLDLGELRLRDLDGAERVHQLQHPALRAQFPPLRALAATPTNLTQPLNSFVGREREQAEIRALLSRTRLLTLLGMGGIGKSRLSLQVAATLLGDYPDGVWLVELAPLGDARRVPHALASVLGVKEDAGRSVTDALLAWVHDRRLLIVLDNCEHLRVACAALAKQLLQAGPGVQVLASSRDVLQVAGETVYPVPALSVPETGRGSAGLDVDALARHEAVRLFLDRAGAVQPAFRLDAGNAGAVAGICRSLDGIPLALELAAARTRALSVQAIAARLADRFRLLVSGDETVLPRQRTLRALIDWSFELLSGPERLLFRRLSVFAGGWTLAAAEAVTAGDGLDPLDVVTLLSNLVDKSLVIMAPAGTRYRMLETVRAYAAEQLADSGEDHAVRLRHLRHHLELAETARPQLAGPEQGHWLAQLDAERDNFLAAHRFSEQVDDSDAPGLRLMHALRPYWINRGELSLGLETALALLARPRLAARDAARCMALFGAGQLSFLAGRHPEAQRHLEECLAIARETGNDAIVARVLQPLGMTCLALRDEAAAARHLDEALQRALAQGDERECASALNARAMLHRLQGRHELAEPLCAQAVAICRRLGDQENIGVGLLSLAMVSLSLGRHEAAQDMLREAAGIAQQTGSQPLLLGALEVAAGLAAARGRWADAAACYGAAQAQRREAGLGRDPADEAFVDGALQAARRALGADEWTAHEARGRRQPLHEWLQAIGSGSGSDSGAPAAD